MMTPSSMACGVGGEADLDVRPLAPDGLDLNADLLGHLLHPRLHGGGLIVRETDDPDTDRVEPAGDDLTLTPGRRVRPHEAGRLFGRVRGRYRLGGGPRRRGRGGRDLGGPGGLRGRRVHAWRGDGLRQSHRGRIGRGDGEPGAKDDVVAGEVRTALAPSA